MTLVNRSIVEGTVNPVIYIGHKEYRVKGVSYRYALSLMGHESSKILDLYYTMYDKDAQRAIAAIKLPLSG